jgi:hypothetical protein
MIASLLLLVAPSAGSAQGLPIGFDAEDVGTVSLAEAGLSQMPDHPASPTETSIARARVVRRDGQTIRLIDNGRANEPSGVTVASAAPVGS